MFITVNTSARSSDTRQTAASSAVAEPTSNSGATDAASVRALVLDERNRELFMEAGHRYNDLLRFDIPWKVGNDQTGQPYGTTTCMPLPVSERLAAGG